MCRLSPDLNPASANRHVWHTTDPGIEHFDFRICVMHVATGKTIVLHIRHFKPLCLCQAVPIRLSHSIPRGPRRHPPPLTTPVAPAPRLRLSSPPTDTRLPRLLAPQSAEEARAPGPACRSGAERIAGSTRRAAPLPVLYAPHEYGSVRAGSRTH